MVYTPLAFEMPDDDELLRRLTEAAEEVVNDWARGSGLRTVIEERIADAIGEDGLKQIAIFYDDSDPDAPRFIISGPDDLKAKAEAVIASELGPFGARNT